MSSDTKNSSPEEQPLKETTETLKKESFEQRSFIEKIWLIKSNISVEPVLAGLIIPSMLARLAIQNLNLDKACRVRLNYTDEICDSFIERKGNLTFYEGEVQKVISNIETWKSVVQTAIPTILVILMGAWSDRTGNRKLCILLPLFGEFLVCISNILSTFFFYEISIEITMFLEALCPAVTGGWVMIALGVFSYISDITDEESRTFRVGLVNFTFTAGIPIGTALSGILLKIWGYYGVFFLSGTIYLITITYGLICLKTKTKPGIEYSQNEKALTFCNIFTLVKETVAVAFKKRDGNLRKKIILLLTMVAIIYGPNHGEDKIAYLFVRYRLKWDALKYSIYSTYSIITHSLGVLFSISVFSKYWGFHDSMLCIISLTSKFVVSVYIAFVRTDLDMYMVPLIQILNVTSYTSMRSMISKLVLPEEIGKIYSLFSLVDTLSSLVIEPTYSAMYARTIQIFTGAVYIFHAIIVLPSMGISVWFFIQHRRETKLKKREAIEERIVYCETEVNSQ
ncbi:unnamed protein product [Euphydryas editha]|uniref:Proton-coupled folate transporter-like n=1 Tax=Euphydryas editha TaxID=104508 RepID=A0AAU9VAN4_EUPED|nr:unnamed protein product [Euphydryas editha]